MLPYFKYTEDIETFCQLMGFTIEPPTHYNGYVCMYALENYPRKPNIAFYHLVGITHPLIPPEKVIEYLTLMLNGYSYENAVKEIGVVV